MEPQGNWFAYEYSDIVKNNSLNPWLIEPGGSMPHSQGHKSI